MLLKLVSILILVTLFSCASNESRRPILESELNFRSGRYQNESWGDSLSFQRSSWFKDATLTQEIIITELKTQSAFAKWMGKDKLLLQECNHFFVTLLYSDINASQGIGYLREEFVKNGLKEYSLLEFTNQIMAHQQAIDWNLQKHKVIGWCSRETKSRLDIEISLPGHSRHKLKY